MENNNLLDMYKKNKLLLFFLICSLLSLSCKKTIIPPTISTLEVKDIFARDAQSGGVITNEGSSKVTMRGVVWSTTQSPTISLSTKTTDGQGIGTYSSKLTGLSANTKYYIRAYATNAIGTYYGNEVNFTTNTIDLNNGLVSYYRFSENTGDSSGQNNHATNSNAKYTTDRFGVPLRAISFSSTNVEYVRSSAIINNVANTFTISCWVNSLSDDKLITEGITGREGYGNQAVLHPVHGGNWGIASQNAGVGLFVGRNQVVVVEHTHQYISAPLVYSTTLNGWHLITLIYENHIPMLYIDGVLVKTGKVSGILNVRPSNGTDINNGFANYSTSGLGRAFSPAGAPAQFNGAIDDFRVYNRVLTQSEINYLANN